MKYFNIRISSDKYLTLYKRGYNLTDSFQSIIKLSNKIICYFILNN